MSCVPGRLIDQPRLHRRREQEVPEPREKRSFGLDVLACSRCGSRMRVLATIVKEARRSRRLHVRDLGDGPEEVDRRARDGHGKKPAAGQSVNPRLRPKDAII
jgi:hypothetical protein